MKGAIVFTDIKSSSVLWRKFPEEMFKALKIHDRRMKNNIEKNDGMIVKHIGDSIMAQFDDVEQAIKAVLKIQSYDPIPVGTLEMNIRIGIASGRFKTKTQVIQGCNLQDFFGHTVNVAARLESNASPISGFAVAFLDTKDGKMCYEIEEMIKKADFEIKEILYKDKCPRSRAKALKILGAECRLADELKGVGTLRAYLVF